MTNNPTASEPPEGATATPARRAGLFGGRLGGARAAVLGRGLDALLGNLGGRSAPKPHEPAPAPAPEPADDDQDTAHKYQAQARRALLSRMQSSPSAPAPVRNDLGRGFTQLMQAGQPASAVSAPPAGGESDENRVILVEVERLEPSPYHGEVRHDPAALRGLAQSVHELGVWQPVVVMPATAPAADGGARFWIISGTERWMAARMVGQREVPVLVRRVTPRAGLQMALADEAHPEHVSPLVRCRLYSVLTGDMGMTVEDLAARVGVEPSEVQRSLAVLDADDFLLECFDRGEITAEMVALLLRTPAPDMRRELLRYAVRYRWDAPRLEKALQARGVA